MTPLEREAWLAERKTGVGSSDAAGVCGLSPYTTPFGVYVDKVYDIEDRDSPAMEWGRRLEPVVAKAYSDTTGHQLYSRPMMRSDEHPHMIANVDRMRVADRRVVEIKTAGASRGEWGQGGTDAIPEHYFLQVQHQLVVANDDEADVAALIGGNDFRIYHVRLDPKLGGKLIEVEKAFWDRVVAKDPPPPDWQHASTPEVIAALNVPTPELTMDLPAEGPTFDLFRRYQAKGAAISAMEKERRAMRAMIDDVMGAHSTVVFSNGLTARRKAVSRAGYTVKPTTYVELRIKGGDEE